MDRRMKEVFDSARRVLDPIGFKFRMVGGKSHPDVILLCSPRRERELDDSDVTFVLRYDEMRQGITKLLRSKGFVNNQRRAVAGGSTSPGS